MPALTRLTLQYRIGDLIGDPNNQQWTASEVQEKIDEGQEQFVLDTRVLIDKDTEDSVSGTAEYTLPSDAMDITSMTFDNSLLKRTSKRDLYLDAGDGWESNSGTPTAYYIDIDPNNQKYGLYPTPSSSGTANIEIEYIKMPPSLTDDSSVPFDGHTLMYPYHMAIAYWASAKLLQVQPDQSKLVMVREYEKEYSKFVSDCIETFKQMSETTPMRMRGGRYFKGL